MKKIMIALLGGAVLAGCAVNSNIALEDMSDVYVSDAKIIVSPFDWGPGVDALLLNMSEKVNASYVESVGVPKVITNGVEREVESVLLSNASGEPILYSARDVSRIRSEYLLVSLKTTFEKSGSPFVYDFKKTMQNNWAKAYPVKVMFENASGIETDCIDKRLCSSTAVFGEQKEVTGSFLNPMTKENDTITLRYKAYESESLKKDGKKNPLVIWLHGQGEGGKDVDIALLGNKVTALATSKIQSYFSTKGGKSGAYVLVPQCETYWMDGGDGTNSAGDVVSRYTKALHDLILAYISENGDIDESRIYIGGCSNGGYMTVNMLVEYPEMFAAAYPNCEAYAFNEYARDESGNYVAESIGNANGGAVRIKSTGKRFMSDEKIERIKHIPIWFVHSANDTIVNPLDFSLPTYQALVKSGAENVLYSYFENVFGVDDPSAEFFGHWVWVYLFNDKVNAVQEAKVLSSGDAKSLDFVPSNNGGGSRKAKNGDVEYNSIFEWLNAQKK